MSLVGLRVAVAAVGADHAAVGVQESQRDLVEGRLGRRNPGGFPDGEQVSQGVRHWINQLAVECADTWILFLYENHSRRRSDRVTDELGELG